MNLAGKTAVVTGGARGIGHAYVERLATDGGDVAVIDIADPAQSMSALPGDGRRLGLACDLSDRDQVTRAVDAILSTFGRVDILVNSAGIFPPTALDTVTLDVWRRVQAVNVESILTLAQAFVPGMKAQRWGRIVNTGSANTLLGGKDLAYLTSKASVHGLTRALANELGEYGITVNAIAPSVVATEGFLGRARTSGPTAEQVFARVSALQSIKRASVPADLGNALGFLVSDAADFITGQILHVDGGLTRSGA
jgi:NAD(P)-dependent dehydrogenase (short-subunit alcohol dehydrogenase family)